MVAKGWKYSIWSGADARMLRNVRFLAQGRRVHLVDRHVVVQLVHHARVGMSLREIVTDTAQLLSVDRRSVQSALLTLLWHQVFTVPLDGQLGGDTRIEDVREDRGVQLCA